jgi:uncharacterized protein (DUF111 family)
MHRAAGETGELTTPTGCALVCALADGWELPAGRVLKTAYGAGRRDIPGMVNALRVGLVDPAAGGADTVAELRCQVDDATGESLALLLDDLLAAGALDAFLAPITMKKGRPGHLLTVLARPLQVESMANLVLSPITMKKGRPGHLLTVLARPLQVEAMADLVLSGCSTIGLRWELLPRRVLPRSEATVAIDGHEVRVKVVELPGGGRRSRPEADDVRELAERLGIGFDAAYLRVLGVLEGEN